MGSWHLLTPSWTAGATASGTSATNAPASNLLLLQQSIKWRVNAITSLQVTLDAGEARPWDTLFLGYHNGTSTGTIRITSNASTGTLFSSPSYDSTALPLTFTGDLSAFAENHSWVATGTTQTFRYIGIEINDASNPDGFFHAGVVVVGQLFTPAMGPNIGMRFGRFDPSPDISLVNGETIVRPKRGQSRARWSFPMQSEQTVFSAWMPIHMIYGKKLPVVAKFDPIETGFEQYLIYYGYADWPDEGPVTFTKYSAGKRYYDIEMGIAEV